MGNLAKEKVERSIQNLREKKSRIYFFVQDSKGNAKASIRFIYQMAKALSDNGFNPILLHEKNDYTGVSKWLDESYMTIQHKSLEEQNLEISPEDFLIVPEIYGFVMDQVKNLPCAKIVLTQQYFNMLETLQPGQAWNLFGFMKCITTSNIQKEHIEKIMRQSTFDVIKPYISEDFSIRKLPPMPIIGIHTREQSEGLNLIKAFYLRFPQYRWFTFRDLRGLSEKEFASSLKECFLSVWVDEKSAFGTFPLESMACGVPVLGKVPDLKPEWMNEENGIWITDSTLIIDFIADFIQNWLEDNIKPELYENIKKTSDLYKNKQEFETSVIELFSGYFDTRATSFEEQINKIEE
jgi:hypothetical protein